MKPDQLAELRRRERSARLAAARYTRGVALARACLLGGLSPLPPGAMVGRMSKRKPGRPQTTDRKVLVGLTEEQIQRLDAWAEAHGHPSRSAAVRALVDALTGAEDLPRPGEGPDLEAVRRELGEAFDRLRSARELLDE